MYACSVATRAAFSFSSAPTGLRNPNAALSLIAVLRSWNCKKRSFWCSLKLASELGRVLHAKRRVGAGSTKSSSAPSAVSSGSLNRPSLPSVDLPAKRR
eukprot:scaffold1375_cov255-Pinguiococcus_pyrenoidosus.AAC.3